MSESSGKSFWRRVAERIMLLCFGVAMALLICEGLLRLYNPFVSSVHGNHIVLAVNRRIVFRNHSITKLGPVITDTRNALGFRGPDPPANFSDFLTIITVGGSTTHCLYLSDEHTWPTLLNRSLSSSFRQVWMDNAGLDGHSTLAHIALMQDHIIKLHPKVVTFLVGRNDMAHGDDDDWEAEGLKGPISFTSPRLFLFSLSGHSEIAALILNGYRSVTAYRLGLTHQNFDFNKLGYYDVPREEAETYLSRHKRYQPGYKERLRRLIDMSRTAGIHPVLITQPMLTGPGVDDVTHVDLARVRLLEQRNGQLLWDALSLYNQSVREVGLEKLVPVIDLGQQMPRSSRYYFDPVHFTNDGAAMAASIIDAGLCPVLAADFPTYQTAPCRPIQPVSSSAIGNPN